MKNKIYFLLYLFVAYLAFGWVGVFWGMPVGVIVFWGFSEVANHNWEEVKKRIYEK